MTRRCQYDPAGCLTTQIDLDPSSAAVATADSYDGVDNRMGRGKDGVVTTWA